VKRKLSSKERALIAFARQEPDRVPIDYASNPGIDHRLKIHFGLRVDDNEGLLQALGVDFRYLSFPYVGPRLHQPAADRTIDEWGIHRRWIEHDSGGYWDYCDFPLKDATLETIENWPFPSPDNYDYTQVKSFCQQMQHYCIVAGNAGIGDIINSSGMLFSMEQVLVHLISDSPVLLRYLDQKNAVQLEVLRRALEIANGSSGPGIDVLYMGEDLGTQIGPMISPKLFRKHLRPRLQQYVDLGKAFGIPVMFHSCGSSSWAFNDFIEMGISVVDTLQPEAANMTPAYLKSCYGERLAFHGCISTGGPVAYGTAEETVKHVKDTLEIMMPGGGYALSPSHQLQDNSPTENVVAMYAAAQRFGRYR
jgi:uroporphyrinogen decarboxylase